MLLILASKAVLKLHLDQFTMLLQCQHCVKMPITSRKKPSILAKYERQSCHQTFHYLFSHQISSLPGRRNITQKHLQSNLADSKVHRKAEVKTYQPTKCNRHCQCWASNLKIPDIKSNKNISRIIQLFQTFLYSHHSCNVTSFFRFSLSQFGITASVCFLCKYFIWVTYKLTGLKDQCKNKPGRVPVFS